jgi:predicted Zn-dependent protease
VQIYCGWVARWSWSGKTLQIASIRGGTGFFIHPDGYILTSAHVVVSMMESPQRLKTLAGTGLLQAFLKANGYGQDEDSQRLLLDRIRQGQLAEPQLVELRRVNVVVLPGGGRFPFQVRSFGVPLGQEGPEVLTGRDVAVLKVDVHDAPTLRLGSSAAVPSGTAVSILAYPPATESDALDESSRPEAAAKVLAVTDADLFIPILTFVFGEAQLGGPAAVVSTARLGGNAGVPQDPRRVMARLVKECVHELGHTFGLIHCGLPRCAMARSPSLVEVDAKASTLCGDCRVRFTDLRRAAAPGRPGMQESGGA